MADVLAGELILEDVIVLFDTITKQFLTNQFSIENNGLVWRRSIIISAAN